VGVFEGSVTVDLDFLQGELLALCDGHADNAKRRRSGGVAGEGRRGLGAVRPEGQHGLEDGCSAAWEKPAA
jgi:hypothetical protein